MVVALPYQEDLQEDLHHSPLETLLTSLPKDLALERAIGVTPPTSCKYYRGSHFSSTTLHMGETGL